MHDWKVSRYSCCQAPAKNFRFSTFERWKFEVGSLKLEVGPSNFRLPTSNFGISKLEVWSWKLDLPTSDFQLRTLEVRSWKSEVGPSNFRLPTSNFGSSKSGSAPRQQMAVRANGFAAPAIKRCTSDARRLGESAVLVQKCRKPIWISYLFYENLRVQDPAGQKKCKRAHFCVFKSERFAREWCTFYEKYKNWKSKMSTAPGRERNNKTTGSAAHNFTK